MPTEDDIESWMSLKPMRKRDILGISCCLYDPLVPGLTCSLKLKYQEYLERYKTHQWNTVCSSDIKQEFVPLLKSVLKAKLEVEVPRYIGKPVVKEEVVSTLLIVNDGKLNKAGCMMAYLHHQWIDDQGETQVECNLLASRNKLLPHTIVDQVRAEIGALGISFNLVDTILSVLDEFEEYSNIKKMLVLDSKTTTLLLTQEPI